MHEIFQGTGTTVPFDRWPSISGSGQCGRRFVPGGPVIDHAAWDPSKLRGGGYRLNDLPNDDETLSDRPWLNKAWLRGWGVRGETQTTGIARPHFDL